MRSGVGRGAEARIGTTGVDGDSATVALRSPLERLVRMPNLAPWTTGVSEPVALPVESLVVVHDRNQRENTLEDDESSVDRKSLSSSSVSLGSIREEAVGDGAPPSVSL